MYCILHECYLAIVELINAHKKSYFILKKKCLHLMLSESLAIIIVLLNWMMGMISIRFTFMIRKKVSHLKNFEKQAILKSFSTSFVDQS